MSVCGPPEPPSGTFVLVYGTLKAETPTNLSDASLQGHVEIGFLSYLNYGCEIGHAAIGRYCSIGQRVIVSPGQHDMSSLSTHPMIGDPSGFSAGFGGSPKFKAVACTSRSRLFVPKARACIGNDVWVGARATIMPGLIVGHGAVVAAGSVVTRSVEDFEIVGGIPARHLGWRFDKETRIRILESNWWNYDLSQIEIRDYSDIESILSSIERKKSAGTLPELKADIWEQVA